MPYKVMIVDDQNMPRQLFEMIVNSSDNYTLVKSIQSAAAADMYVLSNDIDLIIMDIVMADGSNGLDAAAEIKKLKPAIKILIVTSMPEVSFLERAREAGVDSFWYKEVEDKPLLDVMDRTMAGEHVYPDKTPEVKLGLASCSDLTERELEVLRVLSTGCSDQEIADALHISFATVRTHINHMLEKTGFATRTELAINARISGTVIPEI
ncbi:MAG: response regulator transcription factor [Clostridia bacterium]|nr:response regulator transcription factor [Clostridia bacterium]